MSNTPRTDAVIADCFGDSLKEKRNDISHYIVSSGRLAAHARTLESDLTAARAKLDQAPYWGLFQAAQARAEVAEAKLDQVREMAPKLIAVARAAHLAMDNAEEDSLTGNLNICADDSADLQGALDTLDTLPDEPGYDSTGPRKAEYLLSEWRPENNWLMKPALEWLEADRGSDGEICGMIAAMLRDLWRRQSASTGALPGALSTAIAEPADHPAAHTPTDEEMK